MTVFTARPSRKPLIAVIGVLAFAIGTQVVAAAWPSSGSIGLDEPLLAAPPAAEAAVDPVASAPVALPGLIPAVVPRRPRPHHHPGPGQGRRRRPRRRARPGPRGRRLLGGPPDGPSGRHRRRRQARRVRCRRGPDDRRRDGLPAGRTGRVLGPRGPAGLRAGPGDARQHPRLAPPVPGGARPRPLDPRPLAGDSTALGVLGDASLETGDLAAASAAYSRLALVADGSASRVRSARLAFVRGDPAAAVAGDRCGGLRGHRRRARGRRARFLRRHPRRDADRRG